MMKVKIAVSRDDLQSDDYNVNEEIVDKTKYEMPAESILLGILHELMKEGKGDCNECN